MRDEKGPWAAISANMLREPPISALTGPAKLLYLAGILDCVTLLTDGHIQQHRLKQLLLDSGANHKHVAELQTAKVWKAHEQGWLIHRYLDWQPTRAEWETKREQQRERKATWRSKNLIPPTPEQRSEQARQAALKRWNKPDTNP